MKFFIFLNRNQHNEDLIKLQSLDKKIFVQNKSELKCSYKQIYQDSFLTLKPGN